MIKARISLDPPALTITGHANSGQPDIVCAAVSGIAYALAGYILNKQSTFGVYSQVRMGAGDTEIRIREGDGSAFLQAFEMALIGLKQIEISHPSCISVEVDAQDLV